MTWDEIEAKYPEYWCDMTEERKREFVVDLFGYYEQKGFAKVFWSPYERYEKYYGQPFTVIGRFDWEKEGIALELLPIWNIRFEDGFEMAVFPEECVEEEMLDEGCPKEYFLQGI